MEGNIYIIKSIAEISMKFVHVARQLSQSSLRVSAVNYGFYELLLLAVHFIKNEIMQGSNLIFMYSNASRFQAYSMLYRSYILSFQLFSLFIQYM